MGKAYASRYGWILPVGRMLHFCHHRCGAGFWLPWPGIGGCAIGHRHNSYLDSASEAPERENIGEIRHQEDTKAEMNASLFRG